MSATTSTTLIIVGNVVTDLAIQPYQKPLSSSATLSLTSPSRHARNPSHCWPGSRHIQPKLYAKAGSDHPLARFEGHGQIRPPPTQLISFVALVLAIVDSGSCVLMDLSIGPRDGAESDQNSMTRSDSAAPLSDLKVTAKSPREKEKGKKERKLEFGSC